MNTCEQEFSRARICRVACEGTHSLRGNPSAQCGSLKQPHSCGTDVRGCHPRTRILLYASNALACSRQRWGLVSRQLPGLYGSRRCEVAVQARPGHAYLQDGQQS